MNRPNENNTREEKLKKVLATGQLVLCQYSINSSFEDLAPFAEHPEEKISLLRQSFEVGARLLGEFALALEEVGLTFAGDSVRIFERLLQEISHGLESFSAFPTPKQIEDYDEQALAVRQLVESLKRSYPRLTEQLVQEDEQYSRVTASGFSGEDSLPFSSGPRRPGSAKAPRLPFSSGSPIPWSSFRDITNDSSDSENDDLGSEVPNQNQKAPKKEDGGSSFF